MLASAVLAVLGLAGVTTLHLIDGTFELFRAYHAMPRLTAPTGHEVGAIRGLLASTLALLRDQAVTHVAAATDHVIESFRNALFHGYKTGDGIPPDLHAQFALAEEAFEALGISVWPMIEFEADDAIATAAARFVGEVDRIVMLSPDKDLCQCVVGDRVVMFDRIRRRHYDEAAVRVKLGIGPAAVPDLLALVGDTADGIPGLRGWGAKSAAAVLDRFGSLDAIPDDPTSWPAAIRNRARLAATLAAGRDAARLYRQLATLRTDVPLVARRGPAAHPRVDPETGETEPVRLEHLHWTGVPRPRFRDFCARLGFADLASRPLRWQFT